jgi:RNA-binding protein NOB1
VTCTTSQNGEFKIHLKKNKQWSNRGNRYSVPKPVHGASNQRVKGGGKGGWGNELILSADQKEYVRALAVEKRQKTRDLTDPDFLPGILGGDRTKDIGKPRIGAGRNVNSKKR